jgi:hypothetical protein
MTNHNHLLTALVAVAAGIAGLIAAAVAMAALLVPADHPLAVIAGTAADPVMDALEPWAATIVDDVAAGLVVWTGVFALLFTPVCMVLMAREGRRLARQPGGYHGRR